MDGRKPATRDWRKLSVGRSALDFSRKAGKDGQAIHGTLEGSVARQAASWCKPSTPPGDRLRALRVSVVKQGLRHVNREAAALSKYKVVSAWRCSAEAGTSGVTGPSTARWTAAAFRWSGTVQMILRVLRI